VEAVRIRPQPFFCTQSPPAGACRARPASAAPRRVSVLSDGRGAFHQRLGQAPRPYEELHRCSEGRQQADQHGRFPRGRLLPGDHGGTDGQRDADEPGPGRVVPPLRLERSKGGRDSGGDPYRGAGRGTVVIVEEVLQSHRGLQRPAGDASEAMDCESREAALACGGAVRGPGPSTSSLGLCAHVARTSKLVVQGHGRGDVDRNRRRLAVRALDLALTDAASD
jgi:hypothetical protein